MPFICLNQHVSDHLDRFSASYFSPKPLRAVICHVSEYISARAVIEYFHTIR